MMQVESSSSSSSSHPALTLSPSFTSYSTMNQPLDRVVADQFDRKLSLGDASVEQNGEGERHITEEEEQDLGYDEPENGDEEEEEVDDQDSDDDDEDDEEEEEEDDNFEFSFVRAEDFSPISADDIFQDGQIKPAFPLFGTLIDSPDHQRLLSSSSSPSAVPLTKVYLVEKTSDLPPLAPAPSASPPKTSASASASSDDAVEAEGNYCVWRAPPEGCRKSNSTGFSKLRRFREMLLQRSQSDGKDAFVFLSTEDGRITTKKDTVNKNKKCILAAARDEFRGHGESKAATAAATEIKRKGKTASSTSAAAAAGEEKRKVKGKTASSSPSPYGKSGGKKGAAGEKRRSSYLPYRQEILVGFFANTNAMSRNVHPY